MNGDISDGRGGDTQGLVQGDFGADRTVMATTAMCNMSKTADADTKGNGCGAYLGANIASIRSEKE